MHDCFGEVITNFGINAVLIPSKKAHKIQLCMETEAPENWQ